MRAEAVLKQTFLDWSGTSSIREARALWQLTGVRVNSKGVPLLQLTHKGNGSQMEFKVSQLRTLGLPGAARALFVWHRIKEGEVVSPNSVLAQLAFDRQWISRREMEFAKSMLGRRNLTIRQAAAKATLCDHIREGKAVNHAGPKEGITRTTRLDSGSLAAIRENLSAFVPAAALDLALQNDILTDNDVSFYKGMMKKGIERFQPKQLEYFRGLNEAILRNSALIEAPAK